MSWQTRDGDLYAEECSVIRRRLPDVEISLCRGHVALHGRFPVQDENASLVRSYLLDVLFPGNYPRWIPAVAMREPGVEWIGDRHIFSAGLACLCLPHAVPSYLPDGIRFEPFLDTLLTPWLIGQAFYDREGRWPWSERSHGIAGILEGFAELLGVSDMDLVERYARLLVRKNPAKGHEECPCGSGKRLRDCHSVLYRQCREAIPETAMRIYRKEFEIGFPGVGRR